MPIFDPNIFDPNIFDASSDVEVDAGLASGVGSAYNVSTASSVSVDAQLASGSGAANGATPSIAPNTGVATGTGAALNATVRDTQFGQAGLASGTGSAHAPSAHIKVNANATALPTFVAMGTRADSASANISPAIPSGTAVGDILLLVVETNGASVANPDASVWTEVTGSPVTSTAGSLPTQIAAFWRVAVSSTPAPTVVFSSDHVFGVIAGFRGVDPFNPFSQTNTFVASGNVGSYTTPSITTTVANGLVVNVANVGRDQASTTFFGAPSNANLTNLTQRYQQGIATGDGGAILIVTGEKVSAGSTGTTTGTLGNNSGTQVGLTIGLQPINDTVASGRAYNAAAATYFLVNAAAESASGSGDALAATVRVSPRAELASGTGSSLDATTTHTGDATVDAGVASGSGAALAARPLISVNAGAGTGTGAAHDAIVVNYVQTYASAGAATGTGSALGPHAIVAPHLGALGGVGAAYNASPNAYAVDDTVEGDIPTGYMPPLATPIDDNDTTIVVTHPSGSTPDVPFVVIIDGEEVLVTAVSPDGLTWTVVRGYNGTTATSHGAGTVARPALVNIRVDGVLISPDVDYRRSRFTTSAANRGGAGTAEIWVRDLERTHAFVTGAEVRVSFRGVRQWGGYLASIQRQYVFSAGTGRVGEEPRWLVLQCVDYNVLFNKRLFYKFSDPTYMKVKHWANGTWDSVVISDVVNDHLNIGADNLKFDIQHVGTPALPQISCDPNAPDRFGVGTAGWTWGQVMEAIASQTGAVYYIDPDRVFRYVDDSDKQSRFGWDGLSDDPDNVNTIGYRDVEFTLDGTLLTNDHLQWGAGQGSDEMVFHRSTNQPSIDDHGLWQTAEVRFDLYCQDSVNQRAQTWVYGSPQNRRGGKDDRFLSRVTVREPYFRVADVVELESTEFGFNETAPVRNSEITFPTPWDIKVVLTIAHEIDAPWSTLEFWMPQFAFDFDFHGPTIKFPPPIDWPPPWGPHDSCEQIEGDCVVIDTFTRTGSSLGTSDSSHTWGVPIGVTNTYTPTTDGDKAILQVESGFTPGSSETSHVGSGRINLATEGELSLPLTASFRFHYSGLWSSTFVQNPVLSGADPDRRWAPGYADPGTATSLTGPVGGDNYVRDFLQVAVSASVPIYRFNIFNSGGALYAASRDPNTTADETNGAVLIGAQLEPGTLCNVKMHLDSDRAYLKVWPEGSSEPSFSQVQSEAAGNTWADQEFLIFSRAAAADIAQPAFTMYVDDLCIGRTTYMGNALGLPGFGVTVPAVTDDFDRSVSSGWGTGDLGTWDTELEGTTLPAQVYVSGGSAVLTRTPGVQGRASMAVPLPTTNFPQEYVVTFHHEYTVTGGAQGNIQSNELRLTGEREGSDDYLSGRWDYPFNTAGITAPRMRRAVDIDNDTAVSDSPGTEYQTYTEGESLQMRVVFDKSGDLYTVSVYGDGDTEGLSVSKLKPGFTPLFLEYELALAQSGPFGESSTETIFIDQISLGASVDTSNCGDAFDGGGLIFGWGGVDGAPGGTWVIEDSTSASSPDAFAGNSITEGIYLSSTNDLYYGGVTYLDGATFDTVTDMLLCFVVSPMTPNDNASNANGFFFSYAQTAAELTNVLSPGLNLSVYWNNSSFPSEGITVAGGNVAHDISEGVMYAFRVQVDSGAGTAQYKFWDTESEDEPSSFSGAGTLTGGRVTAAKIGLNGGNLWPAGTRTEVNGVTYWLGYGSDAAPPAAPGSNGCIDCADAAPGEFEDPLHDGPNVGEGADSTFEVGDNGGVIFHTDEQFQVGSTEVWVNGLRIRIGADYIEYPRQAMIEILDHVDVGTVEDQASIIVNYVIWTIDDPLLE